MRQITVKTPCPRAACSPRSNPMRLGLLGFRLLSCMALAIGVCGALCAGDPATPAPQGGSGPHPILPLTITSPGDHSIGLGDRVEMTVPSTDPGGRSRTMDVFIDHHRIAGLQVTHIPGPPLDRFIMDVGYRTVDDQAWSSLFPNPWSYASARKAYIGLGFTGEGESMISSEVTLRPVSGSGMLFILFSLLVIASFMIIASRRTNILRDDVPDLPSLEILAHYRPTFSLARFQMALWTIAVLTSYAFIWLFLGELNSLNEKVLILMGTGMATVIATRTVDSPDKVKMTAAVLAREQVAAIVTWITKISAHIAADLQVPVNGGLVPNPKAIVTEWTTPDITAILALPFAPPNAVALSSSLNTMTTPVPGALIQPMVATALANANATLAISDRALVTSLPHSKGFFADILDDGNGVSIHRLQYLLWTLMMVVVFLVNVTTTGKMPEFSVTMLGLMGISSGTYVTIKAVKE